GTYSRNVLLMCASVALIVMGGLIASAKAAADDPPANPPATPRGPAGAGGMRGGLGGLMLLRSEVVQKDLALTDDQKDSITKLQDKARESFSSLQALSQEERQAKMQELRKDQDEKI